MNAMYFTHLAGDIEGIEGWPKQVREEMAAAAPGRARLPLHLPDGTAGGHGRAGRPAFRLPGDVAETSTRWSASCGSCRTGIGEWPERLGVQGLALYSIRTPTALGQRDVDPEANARETLRGLLEAEGREVAPVLAVYERPAELRERMARLIERFYEEHYARTCRVACRAWSEASPLTATCGRRTLSPSCAG